MCYSALFEAYQRAHVTHRRVNNIVCIASNPWPAIGLQKAAVLQSGLLTADG